MKHIYTSYVHSIYSVKICYDLNHNTYTFNICDKTVVN